MVYCVFKSFFVFWLYALLLPLPSLRKLMQSLGFLAFKNVFQNNDVIFAVFRPIGSLGCLRSRRFVGSQSVQRGGRQRL